MSDHDRADGDVDPAVILPDWDLRDDEEAAVWRIVDLSAIETYEPFRLTNLDWYASVSWGLVNEAFRQLLNDAGGQLEPPLVARLDESGVALSERDREGLWSLATEPLSLFPNQITNGGHRLTAMRAQGVRWAIGLYSPNDRGGAWLRPVDAEVF